MTVRAVPIGVMGAKAGEGFTGRYAGARIVKGLVDLLAEFCPAFGRAGILVFQKPQGRSDDLARVVEAAAVQLPLHELFEVLPQIDVLHAMDLSLAA